MRFWNCLKACTALLGGLLVAPAAFAGAAGTVSVWLEPQGGDAGRVPQTVVSFRPPGAALPAFTLSQDRSHDPRFYVQLDDEHVLACSPRFKFPYTLFLPDRWTQIVVTWRTGVPGVSDWFVDGKIFCEAGADFTASRRVGKLVEPPGSAAMTVERLSVSDHASTAEEVHRAFLRAGGDVRAKWAIALAQGADPAASAAAYPHERRVMQDEDTHWSTSKSEITRRLQRIQEAGFNVYMPLVWNGAQMFCRSGVAPMSPTIRDPIDPSYDPLTYLLEEAHKRGIQVHPWIYVVGRQPSDAFPAAFVDGAPEGAFNVHSQPFRDFIVAVAADLARQHDIDGLNLDYIRAVGPCTDPACIDSYRRKYGRSLAEDWRTSGTGASVPTLVEFNRNAVTDIVSRISTGVRSLRPHAVLTVDSVMYDYPRSQQGLDEEGWVRRGYIDAVVNMSYDDPIDVDSLDRAASAIGANRLIVTFRGYDIFGADVVDRSGAAMTDYVRLVRRRWPSAGIGVYHYMHMDSNQLAGFSSVFLPTTPPARGN